MAQNFVRSTSNVKLMAPTAHSAPRPGKRMLVKASRDPKAFDHPEWPFDHREAAREAAEALRAERRREHQVVEAAKHKEVMRKVWHIAAEELFWLLAILALVALHKLVPGQVAIEWFIVAASFQATKALARAIRLVVYS